MSSAKISTLSNEIETVSLLSSFQNHTFCCYTIWILSIALIGLQGCSEKVPDQRADTGLRSAEWSESSLSDLIAQAEQDLKTGNYREAAVTLEQAIAMDSTNVYLRHALADAYLDGLQSRKALETMESAAGAFLDSIQTQLKLSEFQLILKQYSDALITLNRIHNMHPANPDAHLMKGLVFKEQGDTTRALRAFQEATREDPSLLDAWLNAGQMATHLQDDGAMKYFEAGLRIDPNHLPLLSATAQFLVSDGYYDEAIETYRRMLKIDSDHSRTYFDLGLLYLDIDSLDKARDHFNMAVQTEPLFARAYFYRGVASELIGAKDRALADYRQALQLDQNDSDARDGVNRLQSPNLK